MLEWDSFTDSCFILCFRTTNPAGHAVQHRERVGGHGAGSARVHVAGPGLHPGRAPLLPRLTAQDQDHAERNVAKTAHRLLMSRVECPGVFVLSCATHAKKIEREESEHLNRRENLFICTYDSASRSFILSVRELCIFGHEK